MKRLMMTCLLAFTLALVGCGDGAEELYETAQFEELQNNKAHAQKLYKDILKNYPESRYAVKAQERLAAMGSK